MTGKRKRRRPVGETIGGIIVGFDQQIFRTTPPVQELIAKGKPVRTLSGQDGSEFEVVFPDDEDLRPRTDAADPGAPPDSISEAPRTAARRHKD